MKETRCKSCGKKVAFVKDVHGKTQILDLVAPVYFTQWNVKRCAWSEPAHRARSSFVSHFATCPDASKHSKKKP